MNKCPKCSTEFSQNTAGGLCPACLLRQGLDSQAAATIGPETAASSPESGFQRDIDPPMSPEQLTVLLPQFDQFELIGRGGMGVVYKARQKNLDRFIALKVLSPQVARAPGFAERFSREARAMARLNHPNIVAVYDFGSVEHGGDQLCYFTMEFVDGSNLRPLLKQLTSAQALAIVPQICEALQYAHDIGIVHRDIKPENILVDKSGRVKIADFGLAKLLQQARTSSDYTLTRPDLAMGTPSYMAPEQLERPGEVDHRADLYSLGVVFYEMLTGQLPQGRFPLPSQRMQIDVRFDEVVLKALERDRELRYQHASEVRTSIEFVRSSPSASNAAASGASVPPTAAPATKRESLKFYGRAFGLYLLAWLVFGLLWNLGWAGLLISAAFFAVIAWRQGRLLRTYRPEIVAERALEPRWRIRLLTYGPPCSFVLGIFLILLGVALGRDGGGIAEIAQMFHHSDTLTDTSRSFLKSFQAEDPKGLPADVRDLSLRITAVSYPVGWGGTPIGLGRNDDVALPGALLMPQNPSSGQLIGMLVRALLYPAAFPPEFREVPHFWLYGAIGLCFFMAGIADMISCRRYMRSGLAWKPAFKLASLLVASYVAAAVVVSVTMSASHLGTFWIDAGKFTSISGTGGVDKRLFAALDRWAGDHGYVIAAMANGGLSDTHRLPETPMNVSYTAAVLWKPGMFDRLHLGREGIYSRAPEILVQSASTGSASLISITLPAMSWSSTEAEGKAGNAMKEDLYNTLKQLFAANQSSSSQHTTRPFAATGTGPAPSAATQPSATAAPLDLSEPIGLLRAWTDANIAGDLPAAEALCIGPKETLRLMEVDPERSLELVRLNDAISQIFGGQNPNIASVSALVHEVWRVTIMNANILKTDPDHAIAYPESSNKMILQRINGQWKLDYAASYLPAAYQPQPGDLALCRAFYVIPVQRLTQDVLAHKFKTFDDAVTSYHQLQSDWTRIGYPLRDHATRQQAKEFADRYSSPDVAAHHP